MLAAPPTRYARSGEARIAFQVIGDGSPDVVVVGGPASHLDLQWEDPETARVRRRYGELRARGLFDRRALGCRIRSTGCRRSTCRWTTSTRCSTPSESSGSRCEFRALGADLRALTHVMPPALLILGRDYLRWRRREIAGGGPAADPPSPRAP